MEKTLPDAQVRRAELESLFLASLPDIEQVSRFIARRQRLSASEAEDFLSEVNLGFIRSDYAVLASFAGRSSLRTYLTTVIQRLFLDYRRRLWGKWRPSAEALRRGSRALGLGHAECPVDDAGRVAEAIAAARPDYVVHCRHLSGGASNNAISLPRK